MSADKNYDEILDEVCQKINNIESIKEIDILDMKNSLESIENIITDTQAKVSFQEIKEKLENIAFQVDNCNEALLKDLYNDINELKENSSSVGQHIENLQNVQNLALTSAEFEEFQKQQLDLALKTNENIYSELNQIKENSQSNNSENISKLTTQLESFHQNIYEELNQIKENSQSNNSESIAKLETQLEGLHQNLSQYIEQLVAKIEKVPELDEVSSIMSDLASVQHKSIKQTNVLVKDLQMKFQTLQDEMQNDEISNQLAKIGEIYDSLAIIRTWVERVGFINNSIENVYARLGDSIDFDEVAEKVDIIYESINTLNKWTSKIDNVDSSMTDVQSKIASLSNFMEDTKNITNTISAIRSKLDASISDDMDFEDLTNKMDIVYENLTAINEWASKVDVINEKVSNISNAFEDEDITSKVDLIYENISLLNEWVERIDKISNRSDEIDDKINELTQSLSNASKIIDDVPNIKDKLENLSGELNTITHSTKDEADSYIYTLLDIESDFLKLHKFLDDKTNTTTNDINSLKEKFEELNNDISSISIRTNKLILSADDANKEFRTYLESFKNTINELDAQKVNFNPEVKYAMLNERINEMFKLMQNSLASNKNLNNAFVYLAEWVDATGNILNTMSNDIAQLKSCGEATRQTTEATLLDDADSLKDEITEAIDRINALEQVVTSTKNEDVSEIKSLLTGIMVQLNTEALNEKINNLIETNNSKLSELEVLMKEKINQQAKEIVSLEEKLDTLNNKFDQLIEAMASEHSTHFEMKDVLTYIVNQNNEIKEALNTNKLDEVAAKVESFDENINKIVSYIEED